MSELEQIAASVAKALGFGEPADIYLDTVCVLGVGWLEKNRPLYRSGSNLFSSEYWQVRCRDWLHSQGYRVMTYEGGGYIEGPSRYHWGEECPASEFCARAIHALTTDKTSEGKG